MGPWPLSIRCSFAVTMRTISPPCIARISILVRSKGAGDSGRAIVEPDVTQKATPLENAVISRDYLSSIGP